MPGPFISYQRSIWRIFRALPFIIAIALASSPVPIVAASMAEAADSKSPRSNCIESSREEIIELEKLEDRVRDTRAVGPLTKLKLKQEINRLLKKAKAYHNGNSSLTLDQLKEQYDLLYMKVVSLIQDKDIELHHQLCNSWDPIWEYLKDPAVLNQLSALQRGSDNAYY
jgi:hypothetical protein